MTAYSARAVIGPLLVYFAVSGAGADTLAAPDGAAVRSVPSRSVLGLRAEASAEVRLVFDWIVRNNKHRARPFIIADKANGLLYAFLASGELLARTSALYGAARSDTMTNEQADKDLHELRPADMITPAGIYAAHGYVSPKYGPSLRFARYRTTNLLIHRAPGEWRRDYLEASGTRKTHVTYGCINVLPKFLDEVLLPQFGGESTIFVLPERQSSKLFFAIGEAGSVPLQPVRSEHYVDPDRAAQFVKTN